MSDRGASDVPVPALDGAATPPMANGELVFEEPWQGRTFAMAYELARSGVFAWDSFRDRLIDSIGAFERAHPDAEFRYYDCFLEALEATLAGCDLVGGEELETRVETFAARPHGHDH